MAHAHGFLGFCLGALLAAVHLACAGTVSAQDNENATATPAKPGVQSQQQVPGWRVNCADTGKGLHCEAQHTIVMAKTRQLLLRISINRSNDGKTMALLFQLPHGLFNPAGVVTALDAAEPETLQIQTCDGNGCYAGSSMEPSKFAALVKGTTLSVTFQDLKKQKITVPVPLKGLDEAVKKL